MKNLKKKSACNSYVYSDAKKITIILYLKETNSMEKIP
jgi:hypothetical protein